MINIFKNIYVQYGLFTTVLLMAIGLYICSISRLPEGLELYVFDTKGEPSYFIRTQEDVRVLINGGANSEIIRYMTDIIPFYSRRIDKVIVTNDDANNVTGLIDVINRYDVSSIIIPKILAKGAGFSSSTDKIYETFIDNANKLKIPIEVVGKGDEINFNSAKELNKLKFEALFPEELNKFKYSKASPPEMILRIVYGGTSFVLIGNASTKVQKYVASSTNLGTLTNIGQIKSDVLIVPHSISNNSLTPELIKAVKSDYVIYSQSLTMTAATSRSSSNKMDPFYMILDSNRFNLKQKSTIEVLSDGKSVKIE